MLEPAIRDLAHHANFAALTVLLPSGQPMTHIMWVDADDDHILINTETARAKSKAMGPDARVTVVIWKSANPYEYAEVRGHVAAAVTGDVARAHIDTLSTKYTGGPYTRPISSERVIYKIAPDRQRTNF
jgi:Pyridoxamine 5'-phosphate oxidase